MVMFQFATLNNQTVFQEYRFSLVLSSSCWGINACHLMEGGNSPKVPNFSSACKKKHVFMIQMFFPSPHFSIYFSLLSSHLRSPCSKVFQGLPRSPPRCSHGIGIQVWCIFHCNLVARKVLSILEARRNGTIHGWW